MKLFLCSHFSSVGSLIKEEIEKSGTKPHGADRAGAGEAKRRDRATESRKPNGMGTADERLQGTGRRYREV